MIPLGVAPPPDGVDPPEGSTGAALELEVEVQGFETFVVELSGEVLMRNVFGGSFGRETLSPPGKQIF